MPLSYANNIEMRNCDCECSMFFGVDKDENQYLLSDFRFENLNISAKKTSLPTDTVKNFSTSNIFIKKVD